MILCSHTDTTGQNFTKGLNLHTNLIWKLNLQAGEKKQTKNARMGQGCISMVYF